MEKSDSALMQDYIAGDQGAFDEIYRRYSGPVYGFIRSKVRNAESANEVFQLCFTKFHDSREKFDSQYALKPWLFTICRNTVIDFFRGQKGESVVYEDDMAAETETPAPTFEELGLGSIPVAERELVEMRYEKELSYDEISQALGITPTNARKKLSRVVAKLRQFLKGGPLNG